MKTFILLSLALSFSSLAFGQSMEVRRAKADMIKRADDLKVAAEQGRLFFKQEKLKEGCDKVTFIFTNSPQHLTGIMNRMDMSKKKIRRIQNQALEMLRLAHAMDYTCKDGENFEKVDPDLFQKRLKNYAKMVKKQRNIIEDQDTDFDNEYHYSYEF